MPRQLITKDELREIYIQWKNEDTEAIIVIEALAKYLGDTFTL